ncbi:hypothetical protein GCM10010300_82440 [Streptomyces olivaceoviridis]|nr:hypothetical protein GCM10010300_82440 [Streptomyces olivaceoviridis]
MSTCVSPNPFVNGGGAVPSAAWAGPAGRARAKARATAVTIPVAVSRQRFDVLATACLLVSLRVVRGEMCRDAVTPREGRSTLKTVLGGSGVLTRRSQLRTSTSNSGEAAICSPVKRSVTHRPAENSLVRSA